MKLLQALIFLSCLLVVHLSFATSIKPIYPKAALEKGIEGWVELSYVVNNNCSLNLTIIASEPAGTFDESAIRNFRRSTISTEYHVNWESLGIERPSDRVLSAIEYEELQKIVEKNGPWPFTRYIHQPDGQSISCHFNKQRNIEYVEFLQNRKVTKIVSGSELKMGQDHLFSGTERITFSIEK